MFLLLVVSCVPDDKSSAWAQSIDFNGTTSKLENTTADVLAGSSQITVCAWVNADSTGEVGLGRILALDEQPDAHVLGVASANVLQFTSTWSTTNGAWTFPAGHSTWNAVSVTYDGGAATNDAAARVNFADVTETETSTPDGTRTAPGTGYCVGNQQNQTRTWDGRIAYLQVFNTILSAADQDKALRSPGSVTSGLGLFLRMRDSTDINDQSGNGFNATATDLATGADGPGVYAPKKQLHQRRLRTGWRSFGKPILAETFYSLAP